MNKKKKPEILYYNNSFPNPQTQTKLFKHKMNRIFTF